ncbi:MAG: response regulator [Silvanigrellales bacterium]|jgi:two-component system KDP operon response regulator KdpE|nr:response regulator [Silvanigrellales bacterium]
MTTKERILVVDDEAPIRRLLNVSLESHGFEFHEAATGSEGLAKAAQWRPGLILLDLGLPDGDGVTFLARFREWYAAPILILSARHDESQIIGALDAGANDYVTKPFQVGELLARVRVALRHARGNAAHPVFEAGRLKVDLASRRVFVNGVETRFTSTEYELLRVLVRNAGRVLTHRQILQEVWGPRATEQTQYLRVYMNHLRQKIEESPQAPVLLTTEPGVGYRLAGNEE